jgi:hypothetical protein
VIQIEQINRRNRKIAGSLKNATALFQPLSGADVNKKVDHYIGHTLYLLRLESRSVFCVLNVTIDARLSACETLLTSRDRTE